jgi:PAS domain S-box-containing protein
VRQRSAFFSYAVAVVAIAAATAARFAIDPIVGGRVPFATYYLAVTAVAFFGNLGAAIFATIAAALVGNFFFVPPQNTLSLATGPDQIAMGLFIVTGSLVAILTNHLNQTRAHLAATVEAADSHAKAAQLERARLQEIIASIPGVVWEAWGEPDSAHQRVDYVSDYVNDMLGYAPEEWTSRPNFWLEIVVPEDRAAAAGVAARKFASGEEGENEFRWMTKDGRVIWALARSSVIKDDNGKPVGMRGVTFDITDRKQTERRLELLAEISTTGLTAPSFKELANDIARRTAEIVGDYCVIRMMHDGQLNAVAYSHVSPEAEPFMRAIARHTQSAANSPLYADLVRHSQTIVDNNITLAAFGHLNREDFDETFERFRARRIILAPLVSHGGLLGTMGVGRAGGAPFDDSDVRLVEAIASRAALALENARLFETAQRETDEARHARAEAEEAGRVKDEFLATLSHELRTPLNAILGWAHMLQDPQLPAERRRAAIDTIVRNARSQEQLISDILDVQRIMAGKIRLNLRSVDLGDIVRAAAETVQPSADAKRARLQLLLDLDVPPILGDPDRLKQVVWNLLSNAIKFAPHGGQVQVKLLKSDAHCELVVEDNGPGIIPEFMPFMFERFRQADSSTTRTHKGLGLGLAIVRSLVEMHGGTISASNTEEDGRSGAIFTIRLPRAGAQASADGGHVDVIERTPVWLDDAPSLASIRVLVVEDDGDARELIGAILKRCGADVTTTASVGEGFQAFTEKPPDVVVSDIEMPDEDGYSLIRRIRALATESGGNVPAAAITAYASPSDRMKVLGAGFNIHMSKPVQPAQLASVVARLAARHN